MKMYFAGADSKVMIDFLYKNGVKNMLGSYLSFRNKDLKQLIDYNDVNFFLDSGAFSAYTRGIKINIDELIHYIHNNKDSLKLYASLDVIGDSKATLKNLEYMESKGVKPLPVYHYGEPKEILIDFVNKYDYIALGGMVGVTKKQITKHLDSCWKIIYDNSVKKGKPLTKVHGFGINAFYKLEQYPFYSVDATNWLLGGKFRHLLVFENGECRKLSKKQKVLTNNTDKLFNGHYTELNKNNIKENLKIEKHITKLWEARGIKWN